MDNGLSSVVRDLIQTYMNLAAELGESNRNQKIKAVLKKTKDRRNAVKVDELKKMIQALVDRNLNQAGA